MSSKHRSKPKRLDSSNSKAVNSPSSSTTSSSKQFLETSIDGLSSPASSSVRSKPQYFYTENLSYKENVTVTVRFRPLSPREIRQGEEIAWYADGETIVQNEHNPSIAYAYDRVFGPTTTTRHVYDVAAQHVVSGAMEGINGTIFAYGVTSSGKTHTMHGDQRSPGIIPLAVKDAFSIIQETPNREFLLRVSYLEIYNEVVNDLLNPAGQNLRIREDSQAIDSTSMINAFWMLVMLVGNCTDNALQGVNSIGWFDRWTRLLHDAFICLCLKGGGGGAAVVWVWVWLIYWIALLNLDFKCLASGLRIFTVFKGTFVEGIKEEVVLSPAHALSLIAAGEEHRHVGSTNFNLLSSRSHTIFTLTIESSPCGENSAGEAVNLSQLHLIDLAGSESSKAETVGVRRKEGSYINKSLLTLGTVRP
ncbi:hypothetical protein Pint_36376 [Pistacia integerrima]|uniref:Uncharacterized protein n=1 Tax=Pistacia integerrima TaxID=434235 RepID=A0ACC0Y0U0_9ROSI|nr:hypothetical protein Pint_36376 [Pistacia integerrima]